ncbi:uncharacterized protein LOC126676305 [Mercurialis annua]|uniref:uncharacterized protein LOC126676305 n=1 Tax=Mercurialis annua TaxID=3986 RepID=UPI00215E95E8|nr:uncharacterized protein LOC126676305 [Mercurialis annua]
MCTSQAKVTIGIEMTPSMPNINGRPVLQPSCNRVPTLNRRNSFKNNSPPPPPPTPPTIPNSKSPRLPATKRGSDPNGLNSSSEKVAIPSTTRRLERKKSKSFKETVLLSSSLSYSSSLFVESPGSFAEVRRQEMAVEHAQRKMRTAHYGRSKSAKFEPNLTKSDEQQEKRSCTFITPNSDPIYVAYHDDEWGVPVHNDQLLFELLVLSGAQVGSDWTSILRKRQHFRDAFSGFDAEIVANITEKQMISISVEYEIDITKIRGIVDNSNRILQIKKEFGSFEKYIWGFVNNKPISTNYKFGHKIAAKTSKSEAISKDMIKRGFKLVGPTMVHSFMQAAGLTNDHLITCHRHIPCTLLAAHRPTEPQAP